MLLYNVTVKIDKGIEAEWLDWMKSKHIPDMMCTGMFVSCRICRVLDQDEENKSTYTFLYECESRNKLDKYFKEFATALRADASNRFGNNFQITRSVLEVVE